MERNLLEIEQWLSDYERYINRIVQSSLLAVARICYPIMKCFNEMPDIIPTNYEINFLNLISHKHELLLSKHHLKMGSIEIRYDYGNYDVDHWNFKIPAIKYEKGYESSVDELIRIEITKDGKITSIKRVIYSRIQRKYFDQISLSFDRILLMSMAAIYENKLAAIVVNILRDVINAKLDAIHQILKELQNEIGILDIVKLER